jgi:hypothetical protein
MRIRRKRYGNNRRGIARNVNGSADVLLVVRVMSVLCLVGFDARCVLRNKDNLIKNGIRPNMVERFLVRRRKS